MVFLMKVMIIDMASRLNMHGGQQRIATILYNDLKKYFDTYYLGYSTEYMKGEKETLILPKSKTLKSDVRKSIFSEMWIFRMAYYFFVIRNLLGTGTKKEEVFERVLKIKPDVIISNSIQDFALLMYFKRKGLKFKSIYVDHGTIAGDQISGYFSNEGMPLTIGTGISAISTNDAKRKFFNFFDINVALNESQVDKMKKFTGKVKYIPNGMSFKIQHDNKIETRLKERYGISKNDFVVLYLGRLFERQKNISTLIKAFRKLRDDKFKLLIVGSGPSFSDYLTLARGDDRIKFLGGIEDEFVPHIYNISNLFVLPSVWEGFSLTLLEAAAHSLPIILSENAYVEDLKISDIPEVPTFDTFDPVSLRFAIQRLAENKKLREEAIKASKRIAYIFTQEKMIKRYKEIIEDLYK